MPTPALVRRLGVVAATTALAVVALGGIAAACPSGDGTGSPSSHSAASNSGSGGGKSAAQSGKHDKSGKHDQSGGSGGAAGSHSTDGTAGTSGDPSQPQPVSNADQNSGGANGQCPGGPYCSTRDSSPSANGNGNGQASGKPCAGCVGKADNKNPKGQMPGGSDHNAGYECDRNHGIGRGNPAHTGCTSTPPVTTCPSGQVMVNGVCTTPDTVCPSGLVMVAGTCTTPDTVCPSGLVMVAGTCTTPDTTCDAGMVLLNGDCTTPSTTCPAGETMVDLACVLGTGDSRNPGGTTKGTNGTTVAVPTSVLGERFVRTPAVGALASSLPFTGAPTGELVLLAAAVLAAGGGLALAGRRR